MELPNLQPIVDAGARWLDAQVQAQQIQNTWIDLQNWTALAQPFLAVGAILVFLAGVVWLCCVCCD